MNDSQQNLFYSKLQLKSEAKKIMNIFSLKFKNKSLEDQYS